MSLVLDASAYLALLLEEVDEQARLSLHTGLLKQAVYVPPLWWYEVANTLIIGARRGRHMLALASFLLMRSDEYLILTDSRSFQSKQEKVVELASRFALTVHDAAYLELAVHRQATLATFEKALASAARDNKVALFSF